ncbi:MAG: MucR family transcriptional regulator [Pseudooceanicola sp.]
MQNILRRMGRHRPSAEASEAAADAPGQFLQCRETGLRSPILHRHIRQKLGMTPAQYRRKWGLPPDYPLVSRGYRERREAAQLVQGKN